jgi:hypothetical protein
MGFAPLNPSYAVRSGSPDGSPAVTASGLAERDVADSLTGMRHRGES